MKRKIFTFITVLSLCCLTACATETKDNVSANNQNDAIVKNVDNEPTAKPIVEAPAEPTEEPSSEVVDATAEPTPTEAPIKTKEPAGNPVVVYEGIDMESDLPGEEWVETFVGIIEEPKLVVFSDETGRKEIFEKDSIIKFNPETDIIGVFLPKGYTITNDVVGIMHIESGYSADYINCFKLEQEETRNEGPQLSAFYVEYEGEKIEIPFVFVPE